MAVHAWHARLGPWLRAARPSLESWERTAWIAAATQFVTMIGFGLSMPFIPLYVQALGVTERAEVALWSGVLAGSAALALAVMAPIWGALSDRYGRKAMLVRSMLGGAVVISLMGFVSVWQLLGLRVIQGAVTGSQAAAALVAGVVGQLGRFRAGPDRHRGPGRQHRRSSRWRRRGRAARLQRLLPGCRRAAAGRRPYGHLLDRRASPREGPRPPGREQRQLPVQHAERLRLARVPRAADPVGMQFVYSASVGLLPIYMQDIARPDWLTPELASGLSITATAITAALAMPFLAKWTDRRGPHGLLIISLLGSGLVLVFQAVVPTVGVFLALRGVLGVWLAGTTAATSVLTKLLAPVGREGAAFGAVSSAQGLGWGLGPILGAVLVAVSGIPALYLLCGAIMGILVVPAFNARGRGPSHTL